MFVVELYFKLSGSDTLYLVQKFLLEVIEKFRYNYSKALVRFII